MELINYLLKNTLKFFISSVFLLVFFYPASVSAQLLEPDSCYGLRVDAGDERDRCYQASSALAGLISCLASRSPNIVITSIGDDPSFFEQCVTNWTDNQCSHHSSSDHYGGRLIDDGRACAGGSYAVDLRASNLAQAEPIIQQVTDCGYQAVFEAGPGAPHVHASVGNCGGSGGSVASVYSVTKKIEPICFKPAFPIPGFPLNDANDASCANGLILSSKGDAIIVYVNALYKYGAGLAGLMAMFMIVFAAWQWIMASGNAGKIDNAKETIRGALLGLTLLFAGNLLLSNITNRLVSFNGLNINNITTQQLSDNPGRSNSCIAFDETECATMSSLGLCEYVVAPNGAAACLEKQGGPVPGESWDIVSQIYNQNQASRLICCGVSGGFLADEWQIGLIGGGNRDCHSVFDGDTDRELKFDTNSCLALECDNHDLSRSACEALDFCYWDDRTALNNCHFR